MWCRCMTETGASTSRHEVLSFSRECSLSVDRCVFEMWTQMASSNGVMDLSLGGNEKKREGRDGRRRVYGWRRAV